MERAKRPCPSPPPGSIMEKTPTQLKQEAPYEPAAFPHPHTLPARRRRLPFAAGLRLHALSPEGGAHRPAGSGCAACPGHPAGGQLLRHRLDVPRQRGGGGPFSLPPRRRRPPPPGTGLSGHQAGLYGGEGPPGHGADASDLAGTPVHRSHRLLSGTQPHLLGRLGKTEGAGHPGISPGTPPVGAAAPSWILLARQPGGFSAGGGRL